jgi:hypothetical protein
MNMLLISATSRPEPVFAAKDLCKAPADAEVLRPAENAGPQNDKIKFPVQ